MAETCSIDSCGRLVFARGWCNRHYGRWVRHGDPTAGRIDHGERERFYRETVLGFSGDECLIWPYAKNSNGYGKMRFNGHEVIVSRKACEDRHGPPPTPDHEAAHGCGNGHLGCVNPEHLRWATHIDNIADELAHQTRPRGERVGVSKLSNEDALQILSMKGTCLQSDLAKQFGVHQSTISDIWTGRRWAWLGEAA